MPESRTHYQILGVAPTATDAEIRAAWKLLVQVWHPDRYSGDTREHVERETALINGAYATLRVESRRARYDHEQQIATAHLRGLSPAAMAAARSRRPVVVTVEDSFVEESPSLLDTAKGLLHDMLLIAREHPRMAAATLVIWVFLFSGAAIQQLSDGPSGPSPTAAVASERAAAPVGYTSGP